MSAFKWEWEERVIELGRQLAAEKAAREKVEATLRPYLGWSPDQFLRYQAEHKKLQASFVALDSRRYELEVALETAERERDELAAALEKTSCSCKPMGFIEVCPQCGTGLRVVRNTSGVLNDEQFDSMRAGDFFCENCKGVEAKSGYKYWWKRDLEKYHKPLCIRCAALPAPKVTP